MSSDVSAVTHVVQAFADARNHHDADALARLFAERAEFVDATGRWSRGREAIRHAQAIHGMNGHLTLLETDVRFPSPRVAIARARWRLDGLADREGRFLPPRTGVLVQVLGFDAGSWTILDAQDTEVAHAVPSFPV